MKSLMTFFQPLGRALMLPIAVLPIAGLLLRLGQPDMVEIGLMTANIAALLAAAGGAVFDHMGLLFTIGVAAGFARDGNGTACLAGVTCYVIASEGAQSLLTVPPEIGAGLATEIQATVTGVWRDAAIHRVDIPLGIISGLVGGIFYNRFSQITLPDYLAFFGGRRFVPIISGVAGLFIGVCLGLALGPINEALDLMSKGVVESGSVGLFLFGLLNRLLIITGLHHILNNVAYFIVGDWHGTTGDLRRYFAGDPSAGAFMSGFFPVMMFGLPAACLAMYHEARPERRKAVGGMFFSMALTSFLTGVTEPIEFSFMFLAPILYGVHAVLTGLSEVIMNLLGVRLGFTFSAGAIDFALNYNKSTKPWLLLPVGIAYAVAYYAIFRFVIRRWNLPTLGRDLEVTLDSEDTKVGSGDRGLAFVRALGGHTNLVEVAACTTRLRLVVVDTNVIDEKALTSLGALAVLRPSETNLQIVLGPIADAVAMDIQHARSASGETETRPDIANKSTPPSDETQIPPYVAEVVGGAENVLHAAYFPGRWRIEVEEASRASKALGELHSPIRTAAFTGPTILHILVEKETGHA